MSADIKKEEVKALKKIIEELQNELTLKNEEISIYRQELIKFSQRLDTLIFQMASDSDAAAQIHRVLVPTELPQLPGFEVSRKFTYGSKSGGDYFDLFEHEDKMKFGILVASSSGYSMSALFLSFVLKVSHILEAKRGDAAHQILQKIGADLKQSAGPNDFTNAFYGIINRRNYKMEFSSVGDIIGYYVTKGRGPLLLKSTDGPFNSEFSAQLKSITLELEPKSRLCIITHGLTDVLGNDRIIRIINDFSEKGVHDLRNELLFQASQVSGKETPDRDQTVVVLEAKDKVIKLAK